jgi:formylglycine-generating enzyme required for sulfatase activity
MVPVAAGSFMMGESGIFVPVELHRASVAAFAIGEAEITRAQFRFFIDRTGYQGGYDDDGRADARLPVTGIDWIAARAYVRWLSRHTGRRYRLPYEEEWEYVARAGASTRYWWGDQQAQVCGNEHVPAQFFVKESDRCPGEGKFVLRPVASLRANPWGVYDMLGNADEWTGVCFPASLGKPRDAWEDGCHGDNDPRVVRGAGDDRSAIGRRQVPASERAATIGFRVVRELP